MSHAIDKAGAIKSLFLQNPGQIIPQLLLIAVIRNVLSNITHHLRHLNICAAVFRSLQGGHGRGNGGVGVGTGRSHNSGCEGGIVTAPMFHMKDQRRIQHLRFNV